MEIREKLKIFVVRDGEVSRGLPKDFEWLFLRHYVKSNGWTVSGAAYAGNRDFIIWLKEEENKEFQELLPNSGVAPEIFSLIKKSEQWFYIEISIIVKTLFQ